LRTGCYSYIYGETIVIAICQIVCDCKGQKDIKLWLEQFHRIVIVKDPLSVGCKGMKWLHTSRWIRYCNIKL